MACPITWPPNTRCQLVFGLLPRNRFTSSGSRSRMDSRSMRLLDMASGSDLTEVNATAVWPAPKRTGSQWGFDGKPPLLGPPVSPSYKGVASLIEQARVVHEHDGTAKYRDWR